MAKVSWGLEYTLDPNFKLVGLEGAKEPSIINVDSEGEGRGIPERQSKSISSMSQQGDPGGS